MTLPQNREYQVGSVETFWPEPEVTYDKPVELNPIKMQDTYIPQKQADPTYVHEVYLP